VARTWYSFKKGNVWHPADAPGPPDQNLILLTEEKAYVNGLWEKDGAGTRHEIPMIFT
jgi:hypothetical protein